MPDFFQFKQFVVHQDRCGMKVGTDGVLLGAWAEGGKHILDIGTGTGLIALMLAQRCQGAEITGVELNEQAALQAQENVDASPFAHQITIENVPIQRFSLQASLHGHFDSIVSNPPFYHSLKSKNHERTLARHTESLTFTELFEAVSLLLAPEGCFSAVIPIEQMDNFLAEAHIKGLFISQVVKVKTVENKQAKRCLVAFTKQPPTVFQEEEATIRDVDGQYTAWYSQLTGDFYLK
jgi:ribosomal protein L11 methyltransferase (prmA)